MYDNLEEAYGKYSSGPDRRDPRDRDGQGARGGGARCAGSMLAQFQALADRVFRTQFLVLAYQGALQLRDVRLVRAVPARRRDRGHPRAAHARPVRRVQRAVALANGPVLVLLSLWDEFQYAHDPARPARRRARPGAGAGRRPLRVCGRSTTLAGRVELRRRRLPLRRARGAADPRGDHASRSSRERRSRSSAAAARARRR